MSQALSIEFEVNDLNASYELIATSDNHSFQKDLGFGYDLVDFEGDSFNQVIPIGNNYGIFNIRVFAVSNVGVRSSSVTGVVEIFPARIDDTFTFGQILSKDLVTLEALDQTVTEIPINAGDLLEIDSEFVGKDVFIEWSMIPPQGHKLNGQVVSSDLLNDSYFSGFRINFKKDEELLDLQNIKYDSNVIDSISSSLMIEQTSVDEALNNYRDFNLTINENVIDALNLGRDFSVEIVSVDRYGSEATGIINLSNPVPAIENFNHSLNGSQISFSWFVNDKDYSHVNTEVLAIPDGVDLIFHDRLKESALFNQELKNAKKYNDIIGVSYVYGDKVLFNGNVYNCEITHVRTSYSENPETSDNWKFFGKQVDFRYFSSSDLGTDQEQASVEQDNRQLFFNSNLGNFSFKIDQTWGFKYYYTIQAVDKFGEDIVYNVTENGLIENGSEFSELKAFSSVIKISDLRYRELADDLVFNWDIVDQDLNPVDLNQYKFISSENETPSVLGLSGSLYDVHTNQKIKELTAGYNSKSIGFDDEGNSFFESNLPTAKIFDQFKYTRELNNQIYGTGGFPSIYKDYSVDVDYFSGDLIIKNNKLYDCLIDSNFQGNRILPVYDNWSESKTYLSSIDEAFQFKDNIYKTKKDFGPNSSFISGFFNEYKSYPSGAIVIYPQQNVNVYSPDINYYTNDFVVYSGSLYKCKKDIPDGSDNNPFGNREYWDVSAVFDEVKCSYFKSVSGNNSTIPFFDSGWRLVDPKLLSEEGEFFEKTIPKYDIDVSNWFSGTNYNSGDFVVYLNDIWSGTQSSKNQVPSLSSSYWVNQANGQDITFNYQSGDLVFSNQFVYKCIEDNPQAAPLLAVKDSSSLVYSDYDSCGWVPFWENNKNYDNLVFGHVGIPQSGKRSVGLELGIIDSESNILSLSRLSADNPPPYILTEGFNVDSISEATKVKFNFNYALGFQEKTTKVYLYRSGDADFDIVDEYGFPLTGENTPFVKSVVGAGDATFGQNITQIIDQPPIPQIDGVDQITGYYYKILPFDDFGSGVLYEATNNDGVLEKVIVYPKRYNSPNPDVMPGRVLRADPTESAGAVPGPVLDFSGTTAFENFFLNWRTPGSEYQAGSTTLLKQKPNDIDHYEIWASNGDVLYTGDSQGNLAPWDQNQNTGYRKIEGVMYSVGEIPKESLDPALKISGAENIFNVPANSPSLEAVYPGKTNDNKNFWIRAVDFGGNKSPFTGRLLDDNDDILGLSLTLGQASATDIANFEINMTEKFGNSIALVPNNPFNNDVAAGSIYWDNHVLYYQGTGYFINQGSTNSGYLWWDVSERPNPGNYDYGGLQNIFYSGNYSGSIAHPQGGNDNNGNYVDKNPSFDDEDFIIARNSDGVASPVYYSFPNALIGTANIAEAAIINAKIKDLSADKITSEKINSADIQLDQTVSSAGVIRSVGFTGIDSTPSRSGFYLSGDGTFAFQGGNSSLSFEDDTLTLRGKLRQKNGYEFDFLDLSVSPSYFNYIEAAGYEDNNPVLTTFIPEDSDQTSLSIVSSFRNSSVPATGVRFRMDVVSGNNKKSVFGYNDFYDEPNTPIDGGYNISGFVYDTNNFQDNSSDSETRIASGAFYLGQRPGINNQVYGFDYIIDQAFPGSGLADSVILYVSGLNSAHERSVTITRINDGKAGVVGLTPTYRGPYSSSEVYYFEPSTDDSAGRGDIVSFGINHPDRDAGYGINSNYFIAKQNNFSAQAPIVNGILNSSYWSEFGAELDNVATNLLLTSEAYVTDELVIGDYGISGAIVSNGFTGGLVDVWKPEYEIITQEENENYDTAGFLLARTDDGVYFDVGGTGVNGQTGYLRFNGEKGKIEIRGSFTNNTSEEQINATLEDNNQIGGVQGIQDTLATFVGGGYDNNISVPIEPSFLSLASAIVGGGSNQIEGRFSFIGAGFSGICNDNFSAIVAGYNNEMPRATSDNQGANFIGAGQNNVINGGTNQTILGGDNNSIIYTL